MVLARAHVAGTRGRPAGRATSPTSRARGCRRGAATSPSSPPSSSGRSSSPRWSRRSPGWTRCWSAAAPSTRRSWRGPARPAIACVTTYGMSETCGGCVYDGVPLDGVDVARRRGRADQHRRAGPVLGLPRPARPDRRGARRRPVPDGGPRALGDGARRDARLEVLGPRRRRRGERRLQRRPRGRRGPGPDLARARHGAEVVVVGVPHPRVGGRGGGRGRRRAAATTACGPGSAPTLPAFAAPRRLVVLDRLPRTGSGKVDRRRLQSDLSEPEGDR